MRGIIFTCTITSRTFFCIHQYHKSIIVYFALDVPQVKPRPVAIYTFIRSDRGVDKTRLNPTARVVGVVPGVGPWGFPDTSYQFLGKPNSYVEIRNSGKLDTKDSMTILAWIYPTGKPGPIFNYQTNGWGTHLWVTGRKQLFVRFVRRNGAFTHHLAKNVLKPFRWNYVGCVYNKKTGIASLWYNSRRVAQRNIGRHQMRTQYSIRVGARIGDGRYFSGRIACLQVFNVALNRRQIRYAKRRCFRRVGTKPAIKPGIH